MLDGATEATTDDEALSAYDPDVHLIRKQLEGLEGMYSEVCMSVCVYFIDLFIHLSIVRGGKVVKGNIKQPKNAHLLPRFERVSQKKRDNGIDVLKSPSYVKS